MGTPWRASEESFLTPQTFYPISRFQPLSGNLDDEAAFGTSYTATSDSIRDSTAQLASMALGSHEDGSSFHGSRIDEEYEGEEEDKIPRLDLASGGTPVPSSTPVGPSNLTKSLETSATGGSSPDGQATLKPSHSNETSPQISERSGLLAHDTPAQGMVRSPLGRAATPDLDTDDDDLDGENEAEPTSRMSRGRYQTGAAEDTPLLSLQHQRAGRRRESSTHSRGVRRDLSTASSHDSRAMESGISIRSAHERSAATRHSFGYGALAQASAATEAEGSHIPESSHGHNYEDKPLSAGWRIVPTRWRPGRGDRPVAPLGVAERLGQVRSNMAKLTWKEVADASAEPLRLLPATVLGVLMNILDGVSYGLIIFPASYPMFADFGGDGVSMFFVTCVLSQLVFTLGGSIFKGGNGSMMIEVVPFYHILCTTIIASIGDDKPHAVIATTMVAFALSSIFTGIAFLLLGVCRLGVLIGFFPRHILVGCIGGVGVFLIETGLEISGRLEAETGFQYNWETLQYFFQSWHTIALWTIPLGLAVLLRIITAFTRHPLVMPTYFLAITPVFYLIALPIMGMTIPDLRADGWIFDIGSSGEAPFWRYLTYFDFKATDLRAIWDTMPTMVSLTFFSILHVPLNVPALGVSLKEDNVDVDRELTGHGIANLLAGAIGTVPNYLCFSNSLLFYRVGGGSVLSGLMLAGATAVILIAGPGMINYLNVSTVGALIFLLGIDLAKEAVWDTIGRVNRWEYLTIWFIIVVMSLADFVIGILAGICVACLFLTVQMSRRKTVRACFDGSIARSTVRRPMVQRKFLEAVGTQTQILKLQGFLFFATINSVEALIRKALNIAAWQQKPIRFMIIDFSLVSGLDFSAAEAFTRIQRLLEAKTVTLVFCGLVAEGEIGIALRSVDLWADRGMKLEVFPSLNEALENAENSYLRGMYASSLAAAKQLKQASLGAGGALDVPDTKRTPAFVLDETYENSPRRHHLHEAAKTAIQRVDVPTSPGPNRAHDDEGTAADGVGSKSSSAATAALGKQPRRVSTSRSNEQPFPLMVATFRAYTSERMDEDFFHRLTKYFTRVEMLRGEPLWEFGDDPDGLYLIESGALKARYDFEQEDFEINEAMLAGTIAGELSFLSRQARNTTTKAELNSVLWKLDLASLQRLEREEPETFSLFVALLLRVTGEEQDSLMSYLVSRLS